jgi:hypothetical protein
MKQLIKKSLATLLFALPAVATFAATNFTESNSLTMSYVAVISFFAALIAIMALPLDKANYKSLLG